MLKWFLISGGILLTGVSGFFGLSWYEGENNCIFETVTEAPFIICKEPEPEPEPEIEGKCGIFGCGSRAQPLKPLILLYPPHETSVSVSLDYTPGFSATYPGYSESRNGWSVIAHPDGTLRDLDSGYETYGLFWEGNPTQRTYDLSHGFIVRGIEIREFLQEKLSGMGLNTKERSDFIMYWYPQLQSYPYIQITFAGSDYTDDARLSISPATDSLLRVFMIARPLDHPINLPIQTLPSFERKGFSVVEWGGTLLGK